MAYVQGQTGNDENGEPIYGWYDDGLGYEQDQGVITYTNPDGTVVSSGGSGVGATGGVAGSTDWTGFAKSILGKAGTPAGIASLATGLYGMMGGNKPSTPPGWRGQINPEGLTATRAQIPQPEYKPYSGDPVMGRKHFTDTTYSLKGGAPTTLNPVAPVIPELTAAAPAVMPPAAAPAVMPPASTPAPELEPQNSMVGQGYNMGGITGLAHGGRYLKGHTDGMADKLNTDIDGKQAAKLSHGEFVIPADVVSHLGNGNSDAGANVLYKMMDRVRQARTGNPKQGKQIKPEKFMPGGLAALPAYADGGAVAFDAGGVAATPLPSLPTAQESNLSSWAGPGIADYITKGTAIAQQPYQAYQGPLSAGYSPLQKQAFDTAGKIDVPTASMGAYTPGTFDAAAAQKYMNPYLQASLDPQLAEARRQSQITQMGNNAQAVKAGAFGGSRGALMNTETQRNLGSNLANITGAGYNTAFTNAQQQFNADQARKAQEAQFGANYGLGTQAAALNAANIQGQLGLTQNQANLANLNAQLGAGTAERGITAEGIAADQAEFEKQRQFPYQQVQFQRDMISGMPISSLSNTPGSLSGIGSLLSSLGGAGAISSALGYKDVGQLLSKIGLNLGP